MHVPGYPPEVVLGRGGHQMLAIKHRNGDPYLYVFGGRGGDNTVQNRPQVRCRAAVCLVDVNALSQLSYGCQKIAEWSWMIFS